VSLVVFKNIAIAGDLFALLAQLRRIELRGRIVAL
jgi:hypothetical protein